MYLCYVQNSVESKCHWTENSSELIYLENIARNIRLSSIQGLGIRSVHIQVLCTPYVSCRLLYIRMPGTFIPNCWWPLLTAEKLSTSIPHRILDFRDQVHRTPFCSTCMHTSEIPRLRLSSELPLLRRGIASCTGTFWQGARKRIENLKNLNAVTSSHHLDRGLLVVFCTVCACTGTASARSKLRGCRTFHVSIILLFLWQPALESAWILYCCFLVGTELRSGLFIFFFPFCVGSAVDVCSFSFDTLYSVTVRCKKYRVRCMDGNLVLSERCKTERLYVYRYTGKKYLYYGVFGGIMGWHYR